MIAALLAALAPTLHTSHPIAIAAIAVMPAQDAADADAKIAAAGSDVAKLLELAKSFETANQSDAAAKVYKRVLEVDAANETAHKALRHQLYDKKWFDSFAELAKYKREEAARMKEKGLARYKDQWVPEADAPFLNMGWTKDEQGVWTHPADLAQAKQVAEWKAAGYQFRADDNSWIAPGDVDKWSALQWKVGEEWVDMAKANEYHAKVGQQWELAGEHYIVWTTCEWEGGNAARWYADKAYPELVRVYGVEPRGKPHVIVLNSLAQYNQASGGTPPLLPESEGISSLHGAYFADVFFDGTKTPPVYRGAGVCFWDRKDERLRGWGPYWVRWASAQSYAEAIDPSWNTVAERIGAAAGGNQPAAGPFWTEKKIPRWLRYGAASYVERYAKNPEATADGDPWDLRKFAFGELKKAGGLHTLDEIFAFAVDVNKAEDSTRLYHESGLLVAFLLDGAEGDAKLAEKHRAFQAALKSGSKKDAAAAADALQKELAANETKIKAFAGL